LVFRLNNVNANIGSDILEFRDDLCNYYPYNEILKDAKKSFKRIMIIVRIIFIVFWSFCVFMMLLGKTNNFTNIHGIIENWSFVLLSSLLLICFAIVFLLILKSISSCVNSYTILDMVVLNKSVSSEYLENSVNSMSRDCESGKIYRNKRSTLYKLYYSDDSHTDYFTCYFNVYKNVEVGKKYRFVFCRGIEPSIHQIIEEIKIN